MFERLERRAAMAAAARAERRRREIAASLGEGMPRGVAVSQEDERVIVAGRGVARRMLLDPALRWMTREGRDG